jgi:hypothetical protein
LRRPAINVGYHQAILDIMWLQADSLSWTGRKIARTLTVLSFTSET